MAETAQPPTPEAIWLRANWTREAIGKYEKQWIAVKGNEVIDSSYNLEGVLDATIARNPLYAFVYFGPLQ
jgi:hypothetical protein